MQLKPKNSCEVMLEKCALFGSKPKQTVRRQCPLTAGAPALVLSQTRPYRRCRVWCRSLLGRSAFFSGFH